MTSVFRAAVVGWAVCALWLSCALAAASDLRGTKDFADVARQVERYIDEYGAEHVLLALDIDNTVMSMDSDLGSDHWFEWQNFLLNNDTNSKLLVAKTFPGLLEVQGILFKLGHMHPPQPETPAIIADLQKRGIATILLTSRGPEFRAYTERELGRCDYDFAATALPVEGLPSEPFLAYDLKRPEKDGLTAAEVVAHKLQEPRPASYDDGVFMTSGQHKGIMLLTLLADSPRDIKAVVFVDDNVRHVGSVFSAVVDRGLETTVFQYQREDLRVQKFVYGDKSKVDNEWRALKQTMEGSDAKKSPPSMSRPKRKPCCCCCCG